ncbi:MAG: integral membrane protein [Planctomycetota bacterium]|jgi:integral membrane protein
MGIFRFDTSTAHLRAVAFMEGISYLLLLFVAMPIKYIGGVALPVRIVGGAHGFLFVWLALLALQGMLLRKQSFKWALRLGIASLIPFAIFFLDRELADEDEAYRAK